MNIIEKKQELNNIHKQCEKVAQEIQDDIYPGNKTLICYHPQFGSLAFTFFKDSDDEKTDYWKDNVLFFVSTRVSDLERDLYVDRILKGLN